MTSPVVPRLRYVMDAGASQPTQTYLESSISVSAEYPGTLSTYKGYHLLAPFHGYNSVILAT